MSKEFGTNLRAVRKSSGLTIEKIAIEFGVSKPTWATWELGTREPNLTMLSAICSRFGVSADELIGLAPLKAIPHTISTSGNTAIAVGHGASASVNISPPRPRKRKPKQ